MDSLLGYIQKKYSVVDRAIAEALQTQEVYLERSSDEEIARQLQEMENLFISSVPEETSHFNRPTGLVPVEAVPLSRVSPNWNPSREENGTTNFQLEHEDVALGVQDPVDPDNMTYEELQELGENIGSESKGLSEATIASLQVSKVKNSVFSKSKKASENCAICQSDIRKNEMLITLPCKHFFHKDCITTWLKMNKCCPMCKYEIEEKKE